MIDRSTSRTTEISEADLAEQSVPVNPDDHDVEEADLAEVVDRDVWSANVADVVEQSITVPLDDEDFEPDE
ncbi:hypothetical protein [Nocardia arizonensis]|uniref:hypothetical protein n=1 Tax=Nocardia arizonensis TaxID=1141647 RepID=UPI0006CF67B3|nr:hypothetical protein [Nocardia arizonensis]